MDPRSQPGLSRTSASAALSSRVQPSRHAPSRDFQAVPSASKRGVGLRSGGSIRRAAVAQDDVREGYLVWDLTNRAQTFAVVPQMQVQLSGAHSESRQCRSDTQRRTFKHVVAVYFECYTYTITCKKKNFAHTQNMRTYPNTWLVEAETSQSRRYFKLSVHPEAHGLILQEHSPDSIKSECCDQ